MDAGGCFLLSSERWCTRQGCSQQGGLTLKLQLATHQLLHCGGSCLTSLYLQTLFYRVE